MQVKKGQNVKISKGITGNGSGKISNIVIQKNGVIRISK